MQPLPQDNKIEEQLASSLKALSISDNPQPSKCCTTSSSSPPQSSPTSKVPQPRTSQNPVSNELAAHTAPHRKTPPRYKQNKTSSPTPKTFAKVCTAFLCGTCNGNCSMLHSISLPPQPHSSSLRSPCKPDTRCYFSLNGLRDPEIAGYRAGGVLMFKKEEGHLLFRKSCMICFS